MLVSVGVRPDTELAAAAGAELGVKGAIAVDRQMRTNLPDVFAAGDCVITHHRLLGTTYLPLGTTAHKQGRIAGENALGGSREFAGSLGTQVVKVFDLVAARTGLRDHEASPAGFDPLTVASEADDHKAYYPGSHPIHMRYTGDRRTGRLLGVQLVGHLGSEIAKRDRHPRHRDLQRHDRRRDLRPRPLLHPTPRLALGRGPARRPGLDPTSPARGRFRLEIAQASIGQILMRWRWMSAETPRRRAAVSTTRQTRGSSVM